MDVQSLNPQLKTEHKYFPLAEGHNKRKVFVSNCINAKKKDSPKNLFPWIYNTFEFNVQITLCAYSVSLRQKT